MKARIGSLLLITSLLLLGVATTHADNFTVLHSFGNTNKVTGFFPVAPLTQGPDGTLYGISDGPGLTSFYTGTHYETVQDADNGVVGAIFAVNPDGTGFRTLHLFTNPTDGSNAWGGMVLVGDTLYGTTYKGGAHSGGIVFAINTNGTSFTHLYDFGGSTNDGLFPSGTLINSNGVLYGTTLSGGLYNDGTVFSISGSGGTPSYLVNFNGTNGSSPYAGVILSSNTLFGTTEGGGTNGGGVVFEVNTTGSGFSVLQNLGGTLGSLPKSPLFLVNNVLYGSASGSGGGGNGTLFSLNADGSSFTNFYNFSSTASGILTNFDGEHPGPIVVVSNVIYGSANQGGTNGAGTIFSVSTNGSGFVTLHDYSTSGGFPLFAGSILFSSNQLYGTLAMGGSYNYGCLYSINTDGSDYTNFFNFAGSDGWSPSGELLLTNGLLYGATAFGGLSGFGTLYQIGTDGTGYTNLHSFGADTSQPTGGLIMLSNTLYGSTGSSWNNTSAIFAMGDDGSSYTNLYFVGQSSGLTPLVAAGGELFGNLLPEGGYIFLYSIGTNGQNFRSVYSSEGSVSGLAVFGDVVYGSMSIFSASVFSINASGTGLNSVYGLPASSAAPPILVGDKFFGTTIYGGIYSAGSVYSCDTNGSNFVTLHSFSGADGRIPYSPLAYVNGALYGTTPRGGLHDVGTLFSVNVDGTGFAVHHTFTGGADGGNLVSGLHVSGNTLYGVATYGGDMNMGIVFALTAQPVLSSQTSNSNLVLSWIDPNYSLQSAPAPTGSYTTIAGSTSPYTNVISGAQQYFRLISN